MTKRVKLRLILSAWFRRNFVAVTPITHLSVVELKP